MRLNNSFIRFLLVGVLNTIVGLGLTYVFFNGVHFSYWVSTFLGNACGAIVSYFLNKSFTFKSDKSNKKSMPLFVAVILVAYFFSFGVSLGLTHLIFNHSQLLSPTLTHDVAILLGSGIYTITNYIGQRFLVFSKKSGNDHSIMDQS